MKLNCKPGDLAVLVASEMPENIGAIVTVKRPYDGRWFAKYGPAWWCDWKGDELHAADANLRPIRDNDGEDETLQWLEVPRKVAA